ncbi:MAG: amidohydrolase [Deltaproteobacteria bacterium]|nr:amidohydrolase [Deltaproteobacteria bacterium]
MSDLKSRVRDEIDQVRGLLAEVNRFIFSHPEIGYEERQAAARLVDELKGRGFAVTSNPAGLETAFQATISGRASRPHLAILAEYDALPELGHACGHNLIAVSALGAALALGAVSAELDGQVSLIGAPAEEVLTDSGKTRLITAGLFDDFDAAMMVHPFTSNLMGESSLSLNEVRVEFLGQAAHAAACPDLGINAYDAVSLTLTGISFLRQQLRSDARIHWGELKVSGAKNVIPDKASIVIGVRAGSDDYTDQTTERIVDCARGAALMAGCGLELGVEKGFRTMTPNKALVELYAKNWASLGQTVDQLESPQMGSSDMGDVSKVVPAIHPFFKIAEPGTAVHSADFRTAAGSEAAFEAALLAAAAMAMTAIDLLTNPECWPQIRRDFEAKAPGAG